MASSTDLVNGGQADHLNRIIATNTKLVGNDKTGITSDDCKILTLDEIRDGNHECKPREKSSRNEFLLVLSAHNKRTLEKSLAALDNAKRKYRMSDLAYTLATRRSLLAYKCFMTATEGDYEQQLAFEPVTPYKARRPQPLQIAFVFTGQGAQWPQMAHGLMQNFPSYVAAIRRLDKVLSSLRDPPGWSLEAVLRNEASEDIGTAALAQPTVTALQIALVNLMAS